MNCGRFRCFAAYVINSTGFVWASAVQRRSRPDLAGARHRDEFQRASLHGIRTTIRPAAAAARDGRTHPPQGSLVRSARRHHQGHAGPATDCSRSQWRYRYERSAIMGALLEASGGSCGGRQLARVDRAVGLFDHPAIAGRGDGRRISGRQAGQRREVWRTESRADRRADDAQPQHHARQHRRGARGAQYATRPRRPAAVRDNQERSATSSAASRSTASCSRRGRIATTRPIIVGGGGRAVRRRDRRRRRHRQGHCKHRGEADG
jgi:hypothetical protein